MDTLRTILIIGFIALLASCGFSGKKANHADQTLPAMELVSATGEQVNLSTFKGKKVFVNLWATWCPPCVEEMPSIQQLYAQTNKNASFVIISLDKNFQTAINWVKRNNLNIPVYAPSGDLAPLFEVNAIPTTFIFDEEGKLIFRQVGGDNYSKAKFVSMLSGNQ